MFEEGRLWSGPSISSPDIFESGHNLTSYSRFHVGKLRSNFPKNLSVNLDAKRMPEADASFLLGNLQVDSLVLDHLLTFYHTPLVPEFIAPKTP